MNECLICPKRVLYQAIVCHFHSPYYFSSPYHTPNPIFPCIKIAPQHIFNSSGNERVLQMIPTSHPSSSVLSCFFAASMAIGRVPHPVPFLPCSSPPWLHSPTPHWLTWKWPQNLIWGWPLGPPYSTRAVQCCCSLCLPYSSISRSCRTDRYPPCTQHKFLHCNN